MSDSALTLCSDSVSSASSHIIYGRVACAKEKFRAAEKSSFHSKSYILSVYLSHMRLVASVEPVSATMISSATERTLSSARAMTRSSFFTIIHTDRPAMSWTSEAYRRCNSMLARF